MSMSKKRRWRDAVVFWIEFAILVDAFYHFLKLAALLLKWAGVL